MKTLSANRFQHVFLLCLALSLNGCNSEDKPGLLDSMGYHKGKTKVWLKSPNAGYYVVQEVAGADPKTFYSKSLANKEGATQIFGFDAQHVFWGSSPVEEADLASFEYVGSEYSKDKSHGYCQSRKLTDDAAHFEIYDEFGRDSKNVYFAGGVFSDDAENFVRVGDADSRYYKDSTRCWYSISEIAQADPKTMRHLGKDYAADEKHVYHEMNRIDAASPLSFALLDHEFSRDAKSVFFQSEPIEGADPATFKVRNERIGTDKNHCYYYGAVIGEADPATFEVIDDFYCKDAKHVWINGGLITGADPATFRVVDGPAGKSRDAKNEYDMAERAGAASR